MSLTPGDQSFTKHQKLEPHDLHKKSLRVEPGDMRGPAGKFVVQKKIEINSNVWTTKMKI